MERLGVHKTWYNYFYIDPLPSLRSKGGVGILYRYIFEEDLPMVIESDLL